MAGHDAVPLAKRLLAEFFGTAILVYVACGVATVALGQWTIVTPSAAAMTTFSAAWFNAGVLLTALAFGLVLAGLAYALGPVSGCHVNPAVSLGMWASGRLPASDLLAYVVAQCVGAIGGAALLDATLSASPYYHLSTDGLGADGYGPLSHVHLSAGGAFLVETVLTCVFVLVVLQVTARGAAPSTAGLAIGLSLTLVHLLGIPLTGTSVNPARSLGPALLVGGQHLSQIWLFILAPLLGGLIAAGLHRLWRPGAEVAPAPAT